MTAGSSSRATPTPWRIGWREKLGAVGLQPVWPVEANLIFVALPRALDAKLKAAGASYYVRIKRQSGHRPGQCPGPPRDVVFDARTRTSSAS